MAHDFEFGHQLAEFDFQVLVYLDDFLFVSYDTFPHVQALLVLLRQVFRTFGLTLHPDKCDRVPHQSVDFLGFQLAASGILQLTSKRFNKVRAAAAALLVSLRHAHRFVDFHTLHSFVGLVALCYTAVPFA